MKDYEKELKIDLINKTNYMTALKFFNNKRKYISQINYFFDTKDNLLRQKKLALRLREENNSYFIAFKGKKQNNNWMDSEPALILTVSEK